MALRRRQALHGVRQRVAQGPGRFGVRLGEADQADLRRRGEPAPAIDDNGCDDAAVAGEAPALLQHRAADRQEALAVAGDAADRDFVDDRAATTVEPDQVAIPDDQRLLDLAFPGEMGMGGEMARLAMHRDRDARPDHLIHAGQLVARRMARDMDEMIRLGDDLDPEPHQRVLQPADRLLVARDDARGKDRDVALFERDVGMVVARDAGQCRARLALAAGADHQDLVARDVAEFVLGQKARHIGEIAVVARGFLDPPQRTADQRDVAVMSARHLSDRLEPRHVGGKAGHRNPPVVAADQLRQ